MHYVGTDISDDTLGFCVVALEYGFIFGKQLIPYLLKECAISIPKIVIINTIDFKMRFLISQISDGAYDV